MYLVKRFYIKVRGRNILVLLLSTSVCLYCLIIECAVIAVAVNGMTRACSSVEWLIPLDCLSVRARHL
jgi:hypothetical protein